MSGAVVLCIDFSSYVTAIAAIESLAGQIPDSADRLHAAADDLRRAHAVYSLIDQTITPSLLRRQAE